MYRIWSLLDQIAKERGKRNEQHAVYLLRARKDRWPKWLTDVVNAGKKNDRRGIDVVVTADVGHIYLQIKSSQAGIKKFNGQWKRWINLPIEPVVVKLEDDDDHNFRRLMEAIARIRARVLAKRDAESSVRTSESPATAP